MPTDVEVFDVANRRLCFATLTTRRPRGPHAHHFGGPPRHKGVVPPGCTRPLVLFYDLDITDPLLGMPTDLGFTRLPLYAPVFTQCGDTGMQIAYRVESDDSLEILSTQTQDYDRVSDFPERLPRRFVKLEDSYIPPDDPYTALRYSGVFGWRTLTRQQLQAMRPDLEESCKDQYDLSDGSSMADVPLRDLCETHGEGPFLQGAPRFTCPNRRCTRSRSKTTLPVIVLLRDDDLGAGVDLGNEFNSHSRLIWLKCSKCQAVVVTTEGT